MMCESKELLVSFLYDEIDPASKRDFQKHLMTCGECREELAELGATRAQIATWTPPDADLGFRIVREGESAKRRWFDWSPAWGLAAAAIVLAAIGAAIANLDIRYGSDGLVVRTGWNHTLDLAQQSAAPNVTPVDWKARADQLDRRLADLERAMSTRPSSGVQSAASGTANDVLLQRVRDIVGQSETRQQRAFATRLTELMREVEAQRRLDLATIDQGMTRLQNSSSVTKEMVQRLAVRAVSYDAK